MSASHSRLRLPPLHAVLAFEAAARLGSFLGAAGELAVTPSAISHRIRSLEERVGQPLFERGHRTIVLTAAGERYRARVSQALDLLEHAADDVRRAAPRRVLHLQSPPGIGATWLAGQLARYMELDSEAEFLMSAGYALADLRRDAVDMAIHYGEDDWRGLVSRTLFPEQLIVVASPHLVERHALRRPEDLLRVPLLRHPQLSWARWFRAAGLPWDEPDRGPRFDDAVLMLEAAARGAGVALIVPTVFEQSRFPAELREVFDLRVPDRSYYLVLSAAGHRKPWVRDFASWLIRRARGDAGFEPV